MEWIAKMVYPIIKDCESPKDARDKIIAWGKNQEPRDAACALIFVDIMNNEYILNSEPNVKESDASKADINSSAGNQIDDNIKNNHGK